MKKLIYSTLCVVGLLTTTTSCNDYLDTSSPSVVDADFVFSNIETARAAMNGAYEQWRSTCSTTTFGDGLFYAADITGSDIERHPEAFTNQPGRHYPECLYQNGNYASSYGLLSYQKENYAYANLFSTIGKSNAIINAMQNASNFEAVMSAGQPSDLSQLYGEAVALRACAYRELIRFYGDVPYQTKNGVAAAGLTSRDSIYDACIADLRVGEPLMFRVGETAAMHKNMLSRTFVQAFIGRLCLEAAGYQTRRTDLGADFYKDGNGNVISFETKGTQNNNSEYGRRSDWKNLYAIAKDYYKACIDNSGTAVLHQTDPRGTAGKNGQLYGNPYQYFFQQMNNLEYADESIYEYAMTQGIGNDSRSYALGRVSSGGSSKAYPCKAYGQGRINPAFYYGMFDPQDMRRDVSACVTGSNGKGVEKLIPFTPGSTANGGGITTSKWDEARMANPWVAKQRTTGINGPYMRLAEVYLGYAEACAATDDPMTAKIYLNMIRERSFPTGKANTDAFISKSGSLLNAIIEERGFEYAGEGDRRWTLIRTGQLPDAIKNIKEMTKAMIEGLESKGYYTFSNGNTISQYVWTKLVDARSIYGHRLTTQCPAGKENDAVLNPGWRGQNDDWESFSLTAATPDNQYPIYGTATPATNLAIEGLFSYIDPNGAEAAAWEADGYTKTAWGSDLVKYKPEYQDFLFYYYDYVKAPIYLWSFTPYILSKVGFTTVYGFKQE